MLSLAILVFVSTSPSKYLHSTSSRYRVILSKPFSLTALVHVPAARVWHHLLTSQRVVSRCIVNDICLPDPRLAEFVLMNMLLSFLI